ncbi:hypothetical protein GHT06_013870 [Daphnia sinensis]|uniref:Uncharacterized protein n=1 Tax=Daphnia sinensis TaxID=1820382 RepID=A0AAD5PUK9_9CRUS|nr:hypothetical protein GHT06_013870 [Daphnia sinensis]
MFQLNQASPLPSTIAHSSPSRPVKMYKVFVFLTIVAAASAMSFGLGAPLLSKVNYQPAEYTHVRPEVTVQQPEYMYRSVPVPVPVAQPYYTAPVRRDFIVAPQFAYPGFAAPLVY